MNTPTARALVCLACVIGYAAMAIAKVDGGGWLLVFGVLVFGVLL